jgi:hypothetical protein
MLRIQNCNVEFLDRKILQLVPEYLMHIARAADGNTVLAILDRHSAAELERRVNLHRSRIANSCQRRQCGNRLG